MIRTGFFFIPGCRVLVKCHAIPYLVGARNVQLGGCRGANGEGVRESAQGPATQPCPEIPGAALAEAFR